MSIVIELAEEAALHAALAFDGAPVPQGATPAASAIAVQDWASAQIVVAVGDQCRIPLIGGATALYFGSLKPFVL